MAVTIANGQPAGYLPTDDGYGHLTFQVLGTRFKPGCVERGTRKEVAVPCLVSV